MLYYPKSCRIQILFLFFISSGFDLQLMSVFLLCQFHLGRGHIGASMKTSLYRLFEQRAADWYFLVALFIQLLCIIMLSFNVCFLYCSQYFVIPLWRGSGYTTMFSQGLSLAWYRWKINYFTSWASLTTRP